MTAKPNDHPDQVRALLARLDEHTLPSDAERGLAEERMWAAFRAPKADQPNSANAWSTGEAEIVRLATNQTKPSRWPFLLIAAAVLAVAGFGALATRSTLTDVNTAPALPGETPFAQALADLGEPPIVLVPGRYEAALLGSRVSFDIDQSMTIVARSGQYVSLLTQADETLVISRPASLFEGQAATDWFDENEVNVDQTGFVVDGQRIDIWSASLSQTAVAERGCAPLQPCIEFAELDTTEPALWLHAGKRNQIVVLPVDGGPDLVVFGSATSQPQPAAAELARSIRVD